MRRMKQVLAVLAAITMAAAPAVVVPSAAGATSHRMRSHQHPVGSSIVRCTGPPAARTSTPRPRGPTESSDPEQAAINVNNSSERQVMSSQQT